MTLTQVWGCLLMLTVATSLGAMFNQLWGDRPSQRQFIVELLKGVGTIVLTRFFFTTTSAWELLALLALVMGRYWRRQDLSLAAVFGGLLLHDWQIALLVGLVGVVGWTIFRQIRLGIWMSIALMVLALGAQHGGQQAYWLAAIALGGVVGWISQQASSSQDLWAFFRPEHAFRSLDQVATPTQVGQDAAILSQLKSWGYPVLPGWLLVAGDDLQGLIQLLQPTGDRPYMLRLSTALPTQRLQIPYENLTSAPALETAILKAFTAEEVGKQALLIQAQPTVLWSGITYSRPPLPFSRQDPFTEVMPDLITPLIVGDGVFAQYYGLERPTPVGQELPRRPPSDVLTEAAQLSRQLEDLLGSPQALEWCFDGIQLWILRVRPVYHLHPVWTRDYIQEKFPYPLRPFSASVVEQIAQQAIAELYQTLWSAHDDIALVQFMTHHRGYPYLNRTFWEQTLRRRNLTLDTLPTIRHTRWQYALAHPLLFYRYLRWDWRWQGEFQQGYQRYFLPSLKALKLRSLKDLTQLSLLELDQNVEQIIDVLQQLLSHSLRGELILRGRRSLWRQELPTTLATSQQQALQRIALDIRNLVKNPNHRQDRASLFARLAEIPDGESIFAQINAWLQQYGDGADYPWELAQRRWQEDAGSVRQRITDYVHQPTSLTQRGQHPSWRQAGLLHIWALQQEIEGLTQAFLAQLRWHLLAIAHIWQKQGYLEHKGDIFLLKLSEVRTLIMQPHRQVYDDLQLKIQYRRSQFETNQQESEPPQVVYGKLVTKEDVSSSCFLHKLQGQAASSGAVIGRVKRCPHWQQPPKLGDRDILVTPYLHENLFPLLPQVKGIITTKGGILSQGASLARQYQIPMVIQVPDALQKLKQGQWVRLDGRFGQVELLDPDTPSIDET